MRILITGISGFVGKHLTEYLIDRGGNQIMGIDLNAARPHISPEAGSIEYRKADLTGRKEIDRVITGFRPSQVYHLAAQSSVGLSWKNPADTFRANVLGGINLLESIREYAPGTGILVTCTAEEYGPPEDTEQPISEDDTILPKNPYAVSKSALDFLSTLYHSAYGIQVLVTRSFNHIGPGQSEGFVCSDFSKQIALIEADRQEPVIMVGNLEAERDFLDVRDVVRAYYLVLNHGRPGQVYNVCSGKKIRISRLLDVLLSLSTVRDIRVEMDPGRFRPIDIKSIYGDNRKLTDDTGWKPVYNIEDSLRDSLAYWREMIKN